MVPRDCAKLFTDPATSCRFACCVVWVSTEHLESLQSFGFDTSEMPPDLSLALGSYALTPLEIARGYAVFANGGYLVKPHILDKVIDRDGNVIYQSNPETVCDPCSTDDIANDEAVPENIDLQLEELLNNLAEESLLQDEQDSWEAIARALQNSKKAENDSCQGRWSISRLYSLSTPCLKMLFCVALAPRRKYLNAQIWPARQALPMVPEMPGSLVIHPIWLPLPGLASTITQCWGAMNMVVPPLCPSGLNLWARLWQTNHRYSDRNPMALSWSRLMPKQESRVAPNQTGIFEFFKTVNVSALPDASSLKGPDNQSPLPEDLF